MLFNVRPLLPPGTRLVARLEAAATTALKTPVVASIEYNYERDGIIIVSAGAKVFGDLQEASSERYVNVRFHTLRMLDGREEKIEGTGVSLDNRPLKVKFRERTAVRNCSVKRHPVSEQLPRTSWAPAARA